MQGVVMQVPGAVAVHEVPHIPTSHALSGADGNGATGNVTMQVRAVCGPEALSTA